MISISNSYSSKSWTGILRTTSAMVVSAWYATTKIKTRCFRLDSTIIPLNQTINHLVPDTARKAKPCGTEVSSVLHDGYVFAQLFYRCGVRCQNATRYELYSSTFGTSGHTLRGRSVFAPVPLRI